MSLPKIHKEWKIVSRVRGTSTALSHYSIMFIRHRGEWYDEIRFDSHEQSHGRKNVAPHFHIKISTRFKNDPAEAIEEIRIFIDNHLSSILGVIDK